MWCCFKPPDTKIESVNIPKWLNNPEAPEEVSERFGCLEDLQVPITEIPEVVTDIVEPFVLEHSTIYMEPCEITEN